VEEVDVPLSPGVCTKAAAPKAVAATAAMAELFETDDIDEPLFATIYSGASKRLKFKAVSKLFVWTD